MKEFDVSPQTINALRPYHRAFQVAVAELAHAKLGTPLVEVKGAGYHQGGIVVGGRDIIIFPDNVKDIDLRPIWGRPSTNIETATAEAITMVAQQFEKSGVEALSRHKNTAVWGSPLRAFFNYKIESERPLP